MCLEALKYLSPGQQKLESSVFKMLDAIAPKQSKAYVLTLQCLYMDAKTMLGLISSSSSSSCHDTDLFLLINGELEV